MHTGMTLVFQNLDRKLSDRQTYLHELQLAVEAEGAGFDSVWTPEHHFTDYGMTPDVPQFLSWLAAKTSRVRLGTMVSVLPWQDPVRTAEKFILLDHLSEGRAVLGIGRGLGRVEFEGFRIEMGRSRQLFGEYAEAVLNGLESGVIEYDGPLYKQPAVELRPAPYASFRHRTFASAVSPHSFDLMAKLGIGVMVIAQKPWEKAQAEIRSYRARYREINGKEPAKPILCVFVAVGKTEGEAQTMRDLYIRRYAESTVAHYEFDNVGFAEIEGYEYYAGLNRNIEKHGVDGFCDFLADLQVWGTPDQVVARILDYVERLDAGAVLLAPAFGGMPPHASTRNFELLAAEVLPHLKAHDVGGDLGTAHVAEILEPDVGAGV
ncbi:LLM class flavin-dependent oxidoreductase [Mycobacterium malmoense]|uniref:Alkane 1-monooxygenase n=1 Tax=Mycobacterium malmoense TaxID=1780 RepID=A0ABX3ST51_MYCMA|nr:LLM class flavin-dependent oxidoreductase [Mycobacterium malmoense]ORA82731.1 alkane 1-monooxygenase [Mycobacterium malmoense]QZA16268.1 LLM class flavin-dependent oxidoreductase [Mycobacterium malmoense]UNB93075.1 LLM class flavin-dependent oxidoreductase [Mycobacterium malmoense]